MRKLENWPPQNFSAGLPEGLVKVATVRDLLFLLLSRSYIVKPPEKIGKKCTGNVCTIHCQRTVLRNNLI
jgi:hypothetical protein